MAPRTLDETTLDPITEEVELVLTAAEEAAAAKAVRGAGANEAAQDLSDGGFVGGVRVTPPGIHGVRGRDGARAVEGMGRATARRAWMWNGTETLLPLAWDPAGKIHDGARKYLLKRVCLCCHAAGFRGAQCQLCVKSSCRACGSSTDPSKIKACFYLRKEDVPFQQKFYGSIDCFLAVCPRRGGKGFLTPMDMRIHARTRHKMEYQAFLESQQPQGGFDPRIEAMQRQIGQLMAARQEVAAPPVVLTPHQERAAKARAVRAANVANRKVERGGDHPLEPVAHGNEGVTKE